jgi:Ser/Thr protein kinase RdoA (MazF antagonist)
VSEGEPATARAALSHYDVGEGAAVSFVRHGENTTFLVRALDGTRYALRLHRPGYHTIAAIRAEIAWMSALQAAGVGTPVVVAGGDGDVVQQFVAPAGERRSAVLFTWLDGVALMQLNRVELWEDLGVLMGRLHRHGREWTRPAWFERPAWDATAMVGDEPRWGDPTADPAWEPGDRDLILACRAAVRERLAAFGRSEDRFGLIHSDLTFDNVLVGDDGTPALLDFDDCGDGWYLFELAVALFPIEDRADFPERRDALVRGYRRIAPLPDEHLAELPTFLMARRLCSLGWMASRAHTDHARRQRPWRLRTTPEATRAFLAWVGER